MYSYTYSSKCFSQTMLVVIDTKNFCFFVWNISSVLKNLDALFFSCLCAYVKVECKNRMAVYLVNGSVHSFCLLLWGARPGQMSLNVFQIHHFSLETIKVKKKTFLMYCAINRSFCVSTKIVCRWIAPFVNVLSDDFYPH